MWKPISINMEGKTRRGSSSSIDNQERRGSPEKVERKGFTEEKDRRSRFLNRGIKVKESTWKT